MYSRSFIRTCSVVTNCLRKDLTNIYPLPVKPAVCLAVGSNLTQLRFYAKGKDKKKEVKGKKKIEINEQALGEVVDVDKLKQDMERNIHKMNETFVKHLTVRSAAGSLEHLVVSYDGKKYPLIELGQVIRNNPKTVVVNMVTFPQAIPNVLKALADSGMNLNPQQDGTTIYVPVPKVTREHRETMAKNAKTHFVKCRDGIRDVQNHIMKTLKNKEKEGLPTDLSRLVQEQVKSVADNYIAEADKILAVKQAEILGV